MRHPTIRPIHRGFQAGTNPLPDYLDEVFLGVYLYSKVLNTGKSVLIKSEPTRILTGVQIKGSLRKTDL